MELAEAREILIAALNEHAILRGEFTLKSGARSTWFIDAKRAICRHPVLAATAILTLDRLDPQVTAIGGLTMGADPIAFAAAALAQASGRPLRAFSVRKEAKGYGQGGRIAGSLEPDDLACVVEDTPSRGTSLLAAVEAVRAEGARVIQALAVVDRGGTAARVVDPLPFTPLLTAPDLGLPYEGGLANSRFS